MRKILILFAFLPLFAAAQGDITPQVSSALQSGDAPALGTLLMPQVELTLSGQDGSYPRDEAQKILANFFAKNTPKSFVIKHQGTSKLDDQYRIGELVTSRGTYRVTFFMKKSGTSMLVKQIKIESSEDDF